ncbi:hypothetical protein CL622_06130 [archaeon]|nr:hypothetical protein [archaeon]|tara:strand:- start:199 stop:873 length:675 start_codon:yes stop_codon:yes gene_type:complete
MKNKRVYTSEDVVQANKTLYNETAHEYDKRLELYHPQVLDYYQNLFNTEIFSRFEPIKTGSNLNILDVGCGTGYLEQFLAKQSARVTGIDISSKMLEQARAKFPAVDFKEADIYSFEAGQFDAVIANSFLHHCKDNQLILKKIAELVRPGGVLFVGMELNKFVYKYLFFVITLFRKLFLRKNFFKVSDTEKLAEYHIFHGEGMSPSFFKKELCEISMRAPFLVK